MKTSIKILLATLCPAAMATAQTLSINEASAPTGAIIAQGTHNTYTRMFHDHATAGKATRGQNFLMPDTGDGNTTYSVTGLTLKKNGTQAFVAGDMLELWVFAWDPATDGNDATSWIQTGTNGTSDGDPVSGTGMTTLLADTFDLSGLSLTGGTHFTIDLSASPLTMDENTVYAFVLGYIDGDDAVGSYFQMQEHTANPYADGAEPRTQGATSANNLTTTRDLAFWIQGATIDVGIINPTIEASSAFVTSGDPVDLSITFDTTADTALLSTQGGSIDLQVIDATDDVPDDGMVVISESPTSSFTYEVVLTKAGETDESASVDVLVANPADEADDNAFSSAIKADAPLFYYRFEEAADTGFLLDSSGNGHHTADIVGDLGQGSGPNPGGMQNAGQFPGNAAIAVPTTSDTSLAYTMVAVVNSDNIQAGSKNIFSMANGGGTGRSVFYLTNGTFETFLSGGGISIPVTTMPESQTSFLVHAVFEPEAVDPDPADTSWPGEMRVYVDGSLEGSVTINANINDGAWVLGSHKGRTFNFFNGFLDEMAVFNSALSDARIATQGAAFLATADPLLGFVSDTVAVASGSPVTLTWKISDQATAVTINGDTQTISGGGVYTTVVNPSVDTTYTLEVSGPGGPFTKAIDVTILTPPVITSIVADGSTPPNLDIEVLGAANTTYNITASSTLDDGFTTNLGTVTTNGAGVGSATIEGFGNAEFYRLETP